MITPDSRLEHNESEIAAKLIDGEAILINLSNGTYYSMDKVGGFIWALIKRNYSLSEMVETITQYYDVSAEQAKTDVETLAADLLEEKIVRIGKWKMQDEELIESSSPKLTYETPKLNTYRDMNDLLALDPPMPNLEDIPWEGSTRGKSEDKDD
jgi:hypothetical protein